MIRPEPGRARPVYTISLAYRIAEAHELRALENRQLSLVIARCSAKSKALAGQSGSKSGSRKLNTGGSSMRCASLQVISVSQWLCRSNLRGERVGCSGPEQVGPLSGTESQGSAPAAPHRIGPQNLTNGPYLRGSLERMRWRNLRASAARSCLLVGRPHRSKCASRAASPTGAWSSNW